MRRLSKISMLWAIFITEPMRFIIACMMILMVLLVCWGGIALCRYCDVIYSGSGTICPICGENMLGRPVAPGIYYKQFYAPGREVCSVGSRLVFFCQDCWDQMSPGERLIRGWQEINKEAHANPEGTCSRYYPILVANLYYAAHGKKQLAGCYPDTVNYSDEAFVLDESQPVVVSGAKTIQQIEK